jgi:transposase
VQSRLPKDNPFDDRGTEVQPLRPYGVGVDTHKKFIQVCVLLRRDDGVQRFEYEFATTWGQLLNAKRWAMSKVRTIIPQLDEEDLTYAIESTGCYHNPVLLAWRGRASVVNPTLTGGTRRKTDVLDARMLAHQNICGMWAVSWLPTMQIQTLRVLLSQRGEATRAATRAANRIGNFLLRWGHTFHREASVRDGVGRACAEDLIDGRSPKHPGVSSFRFPAEVVDVLRGLYADLDTQTARAKAAHAASLEYASRHEWATGVGPTEGRHILRWLTSVPGVGEVSALTWLAIIGDPTRFETREQVAAYVGTDPSLKVSAGKVTHAVKRRGNARLHHVLKIVAAKLLHAHAEPLGQWGYAIGKRSTKGGFGRGVNAVARRLAIFLWQSHIYGNEFDYERYKLGSVPEVRDVSLRDMDLPNRVVKLLEAEGLGDSGSVARAYVTRLPFTKGIGAKCLQSIGQWIRENPKLPSSLTPPVFSSGASSRDEQSVSSPVSTAVRRVRKSPTRAKRTRGICS